MARDPGRWLAEPATSAAEVVRRRITRGGRGIDARERYTQVVVGGRVRGLSAPQDFGPVGQGRVPEIGDGRSVPEVGDGRWIEEVSEGWRLPEIDDGRSSKKGRGRRIQERRGCTRISARGGAEGRRRGAEEGFGRCAQEGRERRQEVSRRPKDRTRRREESRRRRRPETAVVAAHQQDGPAVPARLHYIPTRRNLIRLSEWMVRANSKRQAPNFKRPPHTTANPTPE
jgi:hypothetical protein